MPFEVTSLLEIPRWHLQALNTWQENLVRVYKSSHLLSSKELDHLNDLIRWIIKGKGQLLGRLGDTQKWSANQ